METKLPIRPCYEMTDVELAEFIEQGAWRENSTCSDESAYQEAAKRLRKVKADAS